MAKPVVSATTLVTEDGVPIDAIHLPGAGDLAIVVAHGFTLSWQRPNVWRIANRFNQMAGVLTFDFRGHGRSGGLSTLGDREIRDIEVVVAWARQLGYQRVAAVGFSMGASIVLRHAGLVGGLDAVVSVSGPGQWYYRGTEPMRRVHFAVEHRIGRFVTKRWLKTRISPEGWKLVPVPPAEAAAQISPVPLLIVHGDQDHYFPPSTRASCTRRPGNPRSSGSCRAWATPSPPVARTSSTASAAGSTRPPPRNRPGSTRNEPGAPSENDATRTPNAAA